MKYRATIKERQYVILDDKRQIMIEAGEGELTDEDTEAVKNSEYGKRLLENGLLVFADEAQERDQKRKG